MSLRSRALLTGVAGGFFKANNDRRDRMSQRMQALADDTATRERERAKSDYDRNTKASDEEKTKIRTLKEAGYIEDDGTYKDLYWKDTTLDDWREIGKPKGISQEDWIAEYKQNRPQGIPINYKSSEEIQRDLTSVYNSIDLRQRNELAQPVLTGLDRMLGRTVTTAQNKVADVFNAGADAVGSDKEMLKMPTDAFERGGPEVPATPTASPLTAPSEMTFNKDQGLVEAANPLVSNITTEKPVTRPAYNSETEEVFSGLVQQEIKGPLGGTTIQYMQRQADGTQIDVTSKVAFADATGEDVRRPKKTNAKPRDSFIKQMVALTAANDAFTTVLPSNQGIMQSIDQGINWLDTMFTVTNDPQRMADIKADALNKYNMVVETQEEINQYVHSEETKRLYNTLGYERGQDKDVDRIVSKTLSNINDTYFIYKAASALRGDTAKELNTKDIDMLDKIVKATGTKAKQAVFKQFASKFKMSSIDTGRNAVKNHLEEVGRQDLIKGLTFARPSVLQPKNPENGMPSGIGFYIIGQDGKPSTVFISQSGNVETEVDPNMLTKYYELMP